MKLVKLVVTNIIALLFVASLHAQKSNYDHHQAFDPTFMNNTGTDYRFKIYLSKIQEEI